MDLKGRGGAKGPVVALGSKAMEYVVAVIDFSALWFGLALCQPVCSSILFRVRGYGLLGLQLDAEMLAQLPNVSHLIDSAVTYPYARLFDGPGDIGVLDLVTLQTRHTYNVLERENGHCGTPCRRRGGNEDTRCHAGHRHSAAKSVQAGRKVENDQSGESRRKVK